MATITNVQAAKYGSAASNSVTVSWTSTPTSGNLLVARAIGAAATDTGAISGWTLVSSARYGATTGFVSIFVKVAGGSEGNVTVTFTGSNPTRLVIEEWSSSTGWAATPLDQSANTNNAGSTVTSRSTGTTGTTTVADELAVSVIGWGSAVTGISWSNSFTASFSQPTGSLTFGGAHKTLSATGTVETTASWTTARLAGAAIATFKTVATLTGAVLQSSETDAAQAIARQKAQGVVQNAETDSAQALTSAKQKALGQNAETDFTQALTGAKQKALEQPSEVDTSQALTSAKQRALGQNAETDSAQALTSAKRKTVGQVTEEDTAQAITEGSSNQIVQAVSQNSEVDLAQVLTGAKRKTLGQVIESDQALSINRAKVLLIGQVFETDLAQALFPQKRIAIMQVVEVNLSQPIARGSFIHALGQAFETETALPISRMLVISVNLVSAAQVVTAGMVADEMQTICPSVDVLGNTSMATLQGVIQSASTDRVYMETEVLP